MCELALALLCELPLSACLQQIAEGALNPIVYVLDKNLEEHWNQDRTSCHRPPGYKAINHNSLAMTFQAILYPLYNPPFEPISLLFGAPI